MTNGQLDPFDNLAAQPANTIPIPKPPPPRPHGSPHLHVPFGPNTLKGIDVSGYDPNTNWPVVRAQGIDFAFIKATEGLSYINRFFHRDWQASKASGVLSGAYHFFRPEDSGTAQAEFLLRVMGKTSPGDLPVVLDWEVSDHIRPEVMVGRAADFCTTIKTHTGKLPIIYMSPGFGDPLSLTWFFDCPLWIANYGVKAPRIPAPWLKAQFWQYGESSHINGVQAQHCDTNLFDGKISDLKAMCY